MKSFDTLVGGGGIIGLFTAWELVKAGHDVAVLERGEFGREASWAAGGILSLALSKTGAGTRD